MRIGIIGVGKLGTAIVLGLIKTNKATEILLSPRSKKNSQSLGNKYEHVKVVKDNQTVIDECDWVFLTLPTSIAEEEIRQLTFTNTSVINCISTLPLSKCQQLIGNIAPVYKAFPLPSIAHCNGPLAYHPHNAEIDNFLVGLGNLFPCEDEDSFLPLATITSLIASHYAFQNTLAGWLTQNDIDSTMARDYLNNLTGSLTQMAQVQPDSDFSELLQEATTTGGLNEQTLTRLRERGVCKEINASLDEILSRLKQNCY